MQYYDVLPPFHQNWPEQQPQYGSPFQEANGSVEQEAQEHGASPAAAAQSVLWIYNEAPGSPFRRYFGFARTTYGLKTLTPNELRTMILSGSPEWLELQRVYEEKRKEHDLRTRARTRLRKDPNGSVGLQIIEELGVDKEEFMQEVRSIHDRLPMNPRKRRYVVSLIRRLEGEIQEYEDTGRVKPGFNLSTLRPSYQHEGDNDDPAEEAGNAAGNRMIRLLHEIRTSIQSQAAEHTVEQRTALGRKIDELNQWREQNDSKLRRIHMPFTEEEAVNAHQDDADNEGRASESSQQRPTSRSSTVEQPRRRRGKEKAEGSQDNAHARQSHIAYPSEAQQMRYAMELSRHMGEAGLYQMQQHVLQPWSRGSTASAPPQPPGGDTEWHIAGTSTETHAQPWRGGREAFMTSLFGHEDQVEDESE